MDNEKLTNSTSIADLPNEMLLAIFGTLWDMIGSLKYSFSSIDQLDFADIVSCSHVSRSWNILANQIVYHDIKEERFNAPPRKRQGSSASINSSQHQNDVSLFGGIWRLLTGRGKKKLSPEDRYRRLCETICGRSLMRSRSLPFIRQTVTSAPRPRPGTWVRNLDLSHIAPHILTDDEVLKWIRSCSNLIRINLTMAQITDKTIVALANSPSAATLATLNLSDCINISDVSLQALAENCPNLVSINLKHTSITDHGVRLLVQKCPHLYRVRIFGCAVTDTGLKEVAKYAKRLSWLDLGQCTEIGDEGLIPLAQGCPGLQWLDISRKREENDAALQRITDLGIIAIVKNCRDLELLDVSYCSGITDQSLIVVGTVAKNLKSLSLKGLHKITGESIFQLGELRRKYHKLIWLQIYNCRNITSAVIDEMIRRLSDGWRKGPYDTNVHREVMNGKSWDDVGEA